MPTSPNTWSLSNIKKMIGRQCGDPDALGYPDAIFDHFIIAVEDLAEDIVAIADIDRALNDNERKRYAEAINISENEIYPMLTEFSKSPAYSNNVASFAITNANFVKVIKVRDMFVNPQNAKSYTFIRLFSMREFTRRSTNPHLAPRSGEFVWINNGNKVFVRRGELEGTDTNLPLLLFHCLISLDYQSWTTTQNLQVLGFGTIFLTTAVNKAAYTMRLQLGLEKG